MMTMLVVLLYNKRSGGHHLSPTKTHKTAKSLDDYDDDDGEAFGHSPKTKARDL